MIRSIKNKVKVVTRKKQLYQHGHFIFSVNTGRSGSDYLAALLSTAENVLAFHEREPYMIDHYLKEIEQYQMSKSKSQRLVKLDQVVRDLAISGCETYVETNHMFGKTFYDVILENLKNVTVIHLNRDIKDTAMSFLKLRYFTSENDAWPKWMINPTSPKCFLKFPALENEYELIFGYLAEMRFRSDYIIENYPANHIKVDLEQLNDMEFVEELFKNNGLIVTDKTREIVGKKVNARQQRKKDFSFEFSQSQFNDAYEKINEIYSFEEKSPI